MSASASVDLEQWFKLLWVDLLYASRYVHFDQTLFSPDWKLLKPQPLLPQIPTLLDRAFEILNRYNGYYDGTRHLDNTFQNWGDYKRLLQAVRAGLLANSRLSP